MQKYNLHSLLLLLLRYYLLFHNSEIIGVGPYALLFSDALSVDECTSSTVSSTHFLISATNKLTNITMGDQVLFLVLASKGDVTKDRTIRKDDACSKDLISKADAVTSLYKKNGNIISFL